MLIYTHILSYYTLFHYFNLCLGVRLDSLSCLLKPISFLTNTKITNELSISLFFQNLSVLFLFATLAFSASMVIQIPNGPRLTIQDVQRIIQLWNRYFKVLEKQGLTTESDRRRIGRS